MKNYSVLVRYIYILLLVIAFLIIIGISSAYFYFNWHFKRSNAFVNDSINTNLKTGTLICWTYK